MSNADPQKFYRLLVAMREAQRAHDVGLSTGAQGDTLKALRLARSESEKRVDSEWPTQIAVREAAATAALVRDLRLVQDDYWRTGDELAAVKAKELAKQLDAELEKLLVS